ncbi:MAG: bifunctional (p)ppGpp synthetase/guanosine-3',5'-bis(diphosphate) 3'-pyrophosphohydrolase [Bacilli bacterium]|nr:bifunctional (p)ppGpp synthetase/guanosine-3',5'-bis(diphosphate) 3'-pyrophosphohydrolase [Bacilli bacterium]
MSKHLKDLTIEKLKDKVKNYITDEKKIEIIDKAYKFAYKSHYGQKRLTGEEYIIHPLNVAYILTRINADYETISAALLHDVVEDCNVSIDEIESKFGYNISILVDGVTKINKLNFSAATESVINNQRKILVGLSEDVRVIIIKLADRLNNMQTLFVHSEAKQKSISKETLDILTPIADRLGINSIKQDLEELCLRYLKPEEYYDIVEKLNATKAERDNSVAKMIESVDELLYKHDIKHEIKGRSKSIYSIYKKLEKGKRFSDIYDLLALRIYVDTEQDCYQALGIIHSKFRPKPKRFKDYIAMPKTNMYQSLHTTVFGVDGQLYEIQIRTYEMDRVAEYGIASHWSYKEKGSVKAVMQNEMEQKLQFFRAIMDLKKEQDNPEDFVNTVKQEVFQNTIYVFTPMGDVIELPNGSTPIDFAYRVHSNVGDKAVGAIVNSNMVPLDYQLKNEDIVKIITNNNSLGPSREWLNIVKTTGAKNKIRAFFNKANKEENIKKGEEILIKELRKNKINNEEFMQEDRLNKLLNELKIGSLTELYSSIGSGKLSIKTVFDNYLKKEATKEEKLLEKVSKGSQKESESNSLISIAGIDDIKVNLASCCNPVPGDRIVGYITKGYGINVHRMVCPNIANIEERLIEVTWNKEESKLPTNILIRSAHSSTILLNIISKAADKDVPVRNFFTHHGKEDESIEMTILVKNKEQLVKFMNDIKMIPEVTDVERLIK